MVIQKEEVKYINFFGVSLQYALINGVFWLNATSILTSILDVPTVHVNRLKDGEHGTLDGATAVQVFVPLSTLTSTVQKLMFSKAAKTEYFDKIMDGGGIDKLSQMLHHSNKMVYHTIENLLLDLEAAKKETSLIQSFLEEKNGEFDTLSADYRTLKKAVSTAKIQNETVTNERDELQKNFEAVTLTADGQNHLICELKDEIRLKDNKISEIGEEQIKTVELVKLEHENFVVQIVAEHAEIVNGKISEMDALKTVHEAEKVKIAEQNVATIEQLNAEHKAVLQPLLERSNLRNFWLGRDASLYSQIALQLVCMAFMFPLINKHYPFESLPTWIGVVFQVMLTAMLPIASILFSLRKRKIWLWGIFTFEVLFSNSQTKLFNPFLGDNIHLIENMAVTFFLPLLLVAFGTLTSERETNKALLIKADE